MRWNQWYNVKSYIRSSLWVIPFVTLLLYFVAIRLVYAVDTWFTWVPLSPWGVAGTRTVLETIVTLTLTFVVFTFGSLLVAIQVASGQLTPRIIAATLLRDNAIRFTVGLFIFSLLFAAGILARQDAAIPQGVAGLAGLLGFGSIAAFLYLIDYAARLLRPVSIISHVGKEGCAVIASVYPDLAERDGAATAAPRKLPSPDRVTTHPGKSAIVLAVNLRALAALAAKADAIIEFVPHVGDFVGTGQPLFRLYGGRTIDERRLRGAVALGAERTIEQDSTFAFRIIVDIAIKALSKAINDPTTAVLAIDQLQHLLGVVGSRHLLAEEICDRTGRLRVIFRTPDWEDFVQLTFSEIRFYGAENFQVARRLRAMIESLQQILPPARCAALRIQLILLDRMLEKLDLLPEDLALARIPDLQGLGGTLSMDRPGA
ncbi:MAG TPA: DUF2254 domain-containing protein [Dongiaceae bacterium]|nr:DUF2254 domain-containing protein [Dongiaceae bacterium]